MNQCRCTRSIIYYIKDRKDRYFIEFEKEKRKKERKKETQLNSTLPYLTTVIYPAKPPLVPKLIPSTSRKTTTVRIKTDPVTPINNGRVSHELSIHPMSPLIPSRSCHNAKAVQHPSQLTAPLLSAGSTARTASLTTSVCSRRTTV